ncbi:hypothetical protein FACS1894219_12950 [Clostridia bacterium]|nr:hypothetical protein FACS1894219_12950 [Clostridia bacterium]
MASLFKSANFRLDKGEDKMELKVKIEQGGKITLPEAALGRLG